MSCTERKGGIFGDADLQPDTDAKRSIRPPFSLPLHRPGGKRDARVAKPDNVNLTREETPHILFHRTANRTESHSVGVLDAPGAKRRKTSAPASTRSRAGALVGGK